MTSSLISNFGSINPDTSLESKRKRRKKNNNQNQNQTPQRWRTTNEQQIYSSKLLEALRHVRRNSSSSSSLINPSSSSNSSTSTAQNVRAIREAADKALAVTAKGRTRWSRAILTNRLRRLKFKKRKPRICTGSKKSAAMNIYQIKEKKILQQPLERRVRVLGRLVPGCKKLSFPVLLEETTDYIAALELQVRTMTALTQLLTSGSSSANTNNDNQLGGSSTTHDGL